MANPTNGDGRFPTTDWTLVKRLRNDDPSICRRALDELCAQYHFPLYCLIRKRGLNHHDAEDALHDFFAKLLRLEAFEELAAEKGRLRTFLAKALDRFLINVHHREKRRRHHEVSVEDVPLQLDPKMEQRYEREVATAKDSPDVIFDVQWCRQLLRRVLTHLAADYKASGKSPLFSALRPVLLSGGSLRGHDTAAIAQSLEMKEPAVRTALLRLLRDYRALLVSEVRQTVGAEADIAEEIQHLLKLAKGGA